MENTTLDKEKTELILFFKNNIVKKIKNEVHNDFLKSTIKNIFEVAFGMKYTFIVRFYGDTLRVSAHNKSNGIIYFLASTKKDSADYCFSNESWKTTFIN